MESFERRNRSFCGGFHENPIAVSNLTPSWTRANRFASLKTPFAIKSLRNLKFGPCPRRVFVSRHINHLGYRTAAFNSSPLLIARVT